MRITEPVLDAQQECDLTRLVEAAVYARHLVEAGHARPGLQQVVDDGRDAWERLWLANVGMVKVLAVRYGRGNPDIIDELVQEGWIALAEALMRYDFTRGVRLSTQAWHWVKHHLAHVMRTRTDWELRTSAEPVDTADPADTADPEAPGDQDGEVRGLLASLSPLERRVLLARANGVRQSDLARDLGLSVASTRRAEERAVRRAREAWSAWAG